MSERETAYHEAGHCLVGYCRGLHIDFVTIVPEIRDGSKKPGSCRWLDTNAPQIRLACRDIAGDIAERILNGETEIYLGNAAVKTLKTETHETKEFPMETGWFSDWPEFSYGKKAVIYQKIVQLLRHEWRAVEALAEALLERKTIQGPETEEILKREIQT